MSWKRLLVMGLVVILATAGWFWFLPSEPGAALFSEGLIALDAGDFEEVERLIIRLESRPDGESPARVLRGGLFKQRGQYREALQELDPTVATGLLRPAVLFWSSECLVKLGELSTAEAVLRTLVSERPQDVSAFRLLSVVYYDLGAMYPTLDALDRVKLLAPDDYRPWHLSGVIHFDFEQYQEAAAELSEALRRHPAPAARTEIQLDLARSLTRLLKYQDALTLLETAVRSSDSIGIQMQCHLALGEAAKAEALVKEAQSLSDSPDLLLGRSRLALAAGQYESALSLLRRLIRLQPHDVEAHHQLSLALERAGQTDAAAQARTRSEQIRTWRAELTKLSETANSKPSDAAVRRQIADLCQKLGRQELADSWLRAALDIEKAAARSAPTGPQSTSADGT